MPTKYLPKGLILFYNLVCQRAILGKGLPMNSGKINFANFAE
jgi:hypothetical protein